MTSDCLQATCTTNHPHSHGHSCDANCQACNGPVAEIKISSGPRYGTDREH